MVPHQLLHRIRQVLRLRFRIRISPYSRGHCRDIDLDWPLSPEPQMQHLMEQFRARRLVTVVREFLRSIPQLQPQRRQVQSGYDTLSLALRKGIKYLDQPCDPQCRIEAACIHQCLAPVAQMQGGTDQLCSHQRAEQEQEQTAPQRIGQEFQNFTLLTRAVNR